MITVLTQFLIFRAGELVGESLPIDEEDSQEYFLLGTFRFLKYGRPIENLGRGAILNRGWNKFFVDF